MDDSPRRHATAVIFLHIGKTAGTTLGRILRRHFDATETYAFEIPKDAREVELPGLPTTPDGRQLHPPREATLATLADVPEHVRARYRLVLGHTVFGVHELLPQQSCYVTMLRHPVALVPSLYNYIRRTPSHYHHRAVVEGGMSLAEFVESRISIETDNSQVRAICGDLETPVGRCREGMLRVAQHHVDERFPVVGITERFDESLVAFRDAFGLTKIHYVRAKTAPRRDREMPLGAGVVDLIERTNSLDLLLYKWAALRLDRQCSPRRRAELERFRRRNRLYRPVGAVTYSFPKRVQDQVVSILRRG